MGAQNLQQQMIEAALHSGSYAELTRNLFEVLRTANPRWSYSVFANKAGIRSRSFPREVAIGARRLTYASHIKFIKGLGLKGDLAKLFSTMVFLQEEDLDPERRTSTQLVAQVEKLKRRLKQKMITPHPVPTPLNVSNWRFVYAALADETRGASLSEICLRTGLKPSICQEIVNHLIDQRLVYRTAGSERFLPIAANLHFANLPPTANSFQEFYCRSLELIKRTAQRSFKEEDRLFYSNVITLDQKNLANFKQRLASLLDEFADREIDYSGDTVVQIALGMAPSPELLKT